MAEMQRKPDCEKPLTTGKSWAYGVGTIFSTMSNSVNNTFYYYFLTNVVGMSPTLMGLTTSVSRILMLFWAPIKGAIMQSTSHKAGKFRFWLIYTYPIGALGMVFTYLKITAAPIVQFLYYSIVFIIVGLFASFYETAHLSLAPLMAKTVKDRTNLTGNRATLAMLGSVLYSFITVPLVAFFGGESKGYMWVFAIYGLCGVVGYWITAWSAKDYDLYPVADTADAAAEKAEAKKEEKKDKIPLSEYVIALVKNPPLIMLFCGDLTKSCCTMIYTGAISYYFSYVVGDMSAMTTFLVISNIGMLLGSYCSKFIAPKLGKKTTNLVAYGGFALSMILAKFFGTTVIGISLFVCLGRFCSGMNTTVSPSMYADIGEYWELKRGRNMTAYLLSYFSINFSIGQIITASVVSGALANVGFSAASQATPEQLSVISNLTTLIPGLILAAGFVLFLFYPLTENKMTEIREQLAAKKA